jgi:prepilin-type N-terminal cleavage/methylation domain-containing protein/prepilin-type processing-associated H-X9-DG protein
MLKYRVHSRRPTAFTLIELLVVVAIIGLLVSLMFPAVNAARESARRTSCANNLRQIGFAVQNYRASRGTFPPGQVRSHKDGDVYAWSVEVLPYLEEQNIYDRIDKSSLITSRRNKGTPGTPGPVTSVISVYLCPSTGVYHPSRRGGRIGKVEGCKDCDDPWTTEETLDPDAEELRPMGGLGAMDYMGISGPHKKVIGPNGEAYGQNAGVFVGFKDNDGGPDPRRPKKLVSKIPDGETKTMMVIECTGQGWFADQWGEGHGVWANGKNIGSIGRAVEDPANPGRLISAAINMRSLALSPPELLAWANEEPRSDHRGGVNAVMADGHVRFVVEDVDVKVLHALGSRAGREPVPSSMSGDQ